MTKRLIAGSAFVGLALATLLASPAHALDLDVTGAEFNFANPGGVDRLVAAGVGDNFLYTNVATVDGNQIDARVTIGAVSASSVAERQFAFFDEEAVENHNFLNGGSLTIGCYSNQESRDAWDSDGFYDYDEFTESDRLQEAIVRTVDHFEDDETDPGINTRLALCGDEDNLPPSSSAVITVDFLVAGSPVTLNNLVVNVQDVDSQQSVVFSAPKPSSFEVTPTSQLEISDDLSSTTFYGEESASDDPDYAVDLFYDGVQSLTYEFILPEGDSTASLSVMFESFFNPADSEDLAPTGPNDSAAWALPLIGLGVLTAGLFVARRSRYSIRISD